MRKVKFEDVATRVNTREDKDNTSLLYYVGGDHIESGEMVVHNRGLIAGSTIGPMFYFGFKKGDILLVSRNPHLRKASMVNFDGICSEKTFVIGTKDESVLLQRYLAVVVQTDSFWNYCEEHKSGGVNFFVNWSTLAKYEFELPDIVEQRIISDKVWAAYEVKESYRKLISATDEIVKSRFIEMFGGNKYPNVRLGEFTDLTWGDTNTTKNSYISDGYLAFSASGPDGKLDHFDYDQEGIVLSAIGADCGKTWFAEGKWSCIKNTIRFWSISDKLDNHYLFLATRDKEYWPRKGGAQPFIPQGEARDCVIPLPPIDMQYAFVKFANQADKSKFELKQAIEKIDKVMRALMQ